MSSQAFKTDIHGIPASYALCQVPGEPDGTYAVVKVLDIPDSIPIPTTTTTKSDTPLHLCDRSKLITQHRNGDPAAPHRTIDPALYTQPEIDWYGAGILPPPLYMCFIVARKCYLCGDMQASDDDIIHGEFTEHFKEGYRFCTACAPYFRQTLYKTLAPIWRFRLEYERNRDIRSPIWVHRTRRDESGKSDRTNSGRPFRYTQWFVSSWIPRKSINRHDPENHFEEDLICVEEWEAESKAESKAESNAIPMSKLVSVMDVFFTNRGSLCDLNYDPNVDDPLNQVRHMTLDEKREIMRRESPPFMK